MYSSILYNYHHIIS